MGKVLEFRPRKAKAHRNQREVKLVMVADQIDAVILGALADETLDPRDIAGLVSHRLGTLIRHIDNKSRLWPICEQLLKKQAQLEG